METLDDIKKKLDALVKDAVEEIASLQVASTLTIFSLDKPLTTP